jgi:hypothetical protein
LGFQHLSKAKHLGFRNYFHHHILPKLQMRIFWNEGLFFKGILSLCYWFLIIIFLRSQLFRILRSRGTILWNRNFSKANSEFQGCFYHWRIFFYNRPNWINLEEANQEDSLFFSQLFHLPLLLSWASSLISFLPSSL